METISLPAHFDGEQILLDEPFELEPNVKLIVTVLSKDENERESWRFLAKRSLARAYGENEPDYDLDLIKEKNPEYEGI